MTTSATGDPLDFLSIKFRSAWSGTVDFDVEPPSIGLGARATKLRRPAGSYTVRAVLSVPNEATGATLTYGAQVKAGAASLARKVGTTTSGKATIVLRIRPGTSTRRVRLRVEVTDAVGNKSSTTRTVPLPR